MGSEFWSKIGDQKLLSRSVWKSGTISGKTDGPALTEKAPLPGGHRLLFVNRFFEFL